MSPTTPHIQPIVYAGHQCLQLQTQHGTAVVALHGAHLLSWIPAGHREVLWVSPNALPEPAAIRGGVPVCWPWFGKQGMPDGAMQHGPVRNRPWVLFTIHEDGPDCVSVELSPSPPESAEDPLCRFADQLQLRLRIDLDECLTQTLYTQNDSQSTFSLTQGLHTYFAVDNANSVSIDGLDGLRYDDKLLGTTDQQQSGKFVLEKACDRVYQQHSGTAQHQYGLIDTDGARRITITTKGSQSVVVWNPGPDGARTMSDVPDDGWRYFFCIEASNAGADSVTLEPGEHHRLTQRLQVAQLRPNPAP